MAVAAETWAGSEKSVDSILGRAATGDKQAVAYLYRRYVPALVYYAERRQAGDAEGVADLAFLDALNALPHMHSRTEPVFRAYAYKATRSRISSDQRRQRVDTVVLDDVDVADSGSIEESVVSQSGFQDLLRDLSPGQRDVIIHRFLGGYSVAETASRLGRSPNAVKQLQFQGLNRLRAAFVVASAVLLVAAGIVLSQTSQSVITDAPAGVDGEPGVDDGNGSLPGVTDQDGQDASDRRPFAVEVDGAEPVIEDPDLVDEPEMVDDGADNTATTTELSSDESVGAPPVTGDTSENEATGDQEVTELDQPTSGDVDQPLVPTIKSLDSVVVDVPPNDPTSADDDDDDAESYEVDDNDDLEDGSAPQPATTTTTMSDSTTSEAPNTGSSGIQLVGLENRRTDRCAGLSSGGSNVVVDSCQQGPDQRFTLVSKGDGLYSIEHPDTQQCLSRAYNYQLNGLNAHIADCDNHVEPRLWQLNRQLWRLNRTSSDWYQIRSATSDYCLDTDRAGGVSDSNVGLRRCDGTSSQDWMLRET